jgi:RNA polymerase sigma factor (sigma-70 family)
MDEQRSAEADPPGAAPAPVRVVGELVAELTPALWHIARAAGLSTEDAEDVVQTSWLSLLSHLDTIREPGAVAAWLVTTTRREAWKVAMVRRRTQPADDEWLLNVPDPRDGVDDQAVRGEEQRALWTALRTLPPRCQRLLRIVAFTPRPDYDAVAAELGMKRGSIGATRRRCLDKLRSALFQWEDGR